MLTHKLLCPGPGEEGQGPDQGDGRGAGRVPGGLPEQGDEPPEEEDEDQGHEEVTDVHCAELSNKNIISQLESVLADGGVTDKLWTDALGQNLVFLYYILL